MYELNKLALLPMCGFIAQLVEHRTSIVEVMGSNPVEALIFFRLILSFQLLKGLFTWREGAPANQATLLTELPGEG